MRGLVFDIETRAVEDWVADEFKPEFKARENLVSESAIQKDLIKKEEKWYSNLALSALTAEVIAVGIWTPENGMEYLTIRDADEKQIVGWFWDKASEYADGVLIGHNILGFDLPFLVRRAWKHGLAPGIGIDLKRDQRIRDTMLIWQGGNYQEKFISLDDLSRFLGVGEKSGNGKFFAELLENDPKKAINYLANDVDLTRLCAQRMLGSHYDLEVYQ